MGAVWGSRSGFLAWRPADGMSAGLDATRLHQYILGVMMNHGSGQCLDSLRSVARSPAERILRARGGAFPRPEARSFFDEATFTASYVVHDPATRAARSSTSVLDYDQGLRPHQLRVRRRDHRLRRAEGLTVEWLLETHAHADHLSAAPYLQEQLGGKLAIGARNIRVQEVFERSSTTARSSRATARSSTSCSRTASASGSATIERS